MTTILAFSDSSGAALPQKLLDVARESDRVFFLGDGIRGLDSLLFHKGIHIVQGNCDPPAAGIAREEIVSVDGVKILLCHGDRYRVKYDFLTLALRAKEVGCSAAFYGHTHTARIDLYEGVTLICPGSPTYPSFGAPSYVYAVAHDGTLTAKVVTL